MNESTWVIWIVTSAGAGYMAATATPEYLHGPGPFTFGACLMLGVGVSSISNWARNRKRKTK